MCIKLIDGDIFDVCDTVVSYTSTIKVLAVWIITCQSMSRRRGLSQYKERVTPNILIVKKYMET